MESYRPLPAANEAAVAYRELTKLESFVIYMALDRLARKLDGFSKPLRVPESPAGLSKY